MWQEVDSTSVVGKEAFYCFRLDFDVAFGSLRIVDSQNKILSVGKDCVYVETESYTIVGLGDYFISKPTIFCKWKKKAKLGAQRRVVIAWWLWLDKQPNK